MNLTDAVLWTLMAIVLAALVLGIAAAILAPMPQ